MERAGVDVLFGEKQAKQNVSEGTHTPMLSRMSGRDTCPAPRAAVSEIYRVATAHGGWRRLVVLNLLRLEFVYDLEHGVVDRVEAALLVGVPLIARTTEKFEEIDADVVLIGTLGQNGMVKTIRGNTAERVISALDVDVVVINSEYES